MSIRNLFGFSNRENCEIKNPIIFVEQSKIDVPNKNASSLHPGMLFFVNFVVIKIIGRKINPIKIKSTNCYGSFCY